jgi:hypothetical protein
MDGLKVLKNCIVCVGSFNSDSELMKRMHNRITIHNLKWENCLKVVIIATADVQNPTIFDFIFFE